MMKRLLLGAFIGAAVIVPAASAQATAWKSCGSMSRLVNEGYNRATARMARERDPDTTITCGTARSVARKVLKR